MSSTTVEKCYNFATRVHIDALRECINTLDELDDAKEQNRRLTLQLADARNQLADARTRLELCPLHRFQNWLRRVA
jgi:hypothetical protein